MPACKSAQAINEEARVIAEAISSMSASVRADILTCAAPGRLGRVRLSGRQADEPAQPVGGRRRALRTQLGLIDPDREATMSKFAAEEKAIRDAAAAQANAQAEQQRAAEAAHSERCAPWKRSELRRSACGTTSTTWACPTPHR